MSATLFAAVKRDSVTQAPTPTAVAPAEQVGEMTHREVLEALSGLLLAMFVAMLSSTVVSNALPVGGLLVSSISSGRIIASTGYWKRWLDGGMVLVIAGLAALSTIDEATNLAVVGAFMALLGLGLGRRHHAEPRTRRAEHHHPGRLRGRQLSRRVLPVNGWFDRRLRPGCGAQPRRRQDRVGGPGTDGDHERRSPDRVDPRPLRAAGAGAHALRASLR